MFAKITNKFNSLLFVRTDKNDFLIKTKNPNQSMKDDSGL